MRLALALFAGIAVLAANPAEAQRKPKLTPVELQALQSREFETDKKILFASVMSVLQDTGYTVEDADFETGFIRANSPASGRQGILDILIGFSNTQTSRVTAFIEEMGSQRSRVRLNFVNTVESSGDGQTSRRDTPVLDAETYQVAWEKIDEAIFVRASTTAVAPGSEARPITVGTPPAAASAGPPKRKAKTPSGFCFDVPQGYVGKGTVEQPNLTPAAPACYKLLQQ
jgi:hypothetical protein